MLLLSLWMSLFRSNRFSILCCGTAPQKIPFTSKFYSSTLHSASSKFLIFPLCEFFRANFTRLVACLAAEIECFEFERRNSEGKIRTANRRTNDLTRVSQAAAIACICACFCLPACISHPHSRCISTFCFPSACCLCLSASTREFSCQFAIKRLLEFPFHRIILSDELNMPRSNEFRYSTGRGKFRWIEKDCLNNKLRWIRCRCIFDGVTIEIGMCVLRVYRSASQLVSN